ncbi:MAG: 7-cyano-7-deazaguanine synthase QueC [Candidatus Poribacteria bacterium]|nr:7-cyano-7-deazaguanine synthase QueC [Candidatus Poribacteria bacterium]
MSKIAVVLLSGGLDSTTTLAIALNEGYDCYVMSFRYGQRNKVELQCAENTAKLMGAKQHNIIDIDLRTFGASALTDDIDVPKGRSDVEMEGGIPITYVPARNTIFLSYALAWAEVLAADTIFIGVNAIDYSGYPDCRPEYISAYQKMAALATQAGVEGPTKLTIRTPLIDKTKAEIIQIGTALGVDYSLTLSCYDPDMDGQACGECDSCVLRKKGFEDAGISDPTRYQ